MKKCPREDPNNLNVDDFFEIDCPKCGESIEFIKDEASRKCPKCGETVSNSRLTAE